MMIKSLSSAQWEGSSYGSAESTIRKPANQEKSDAKC